MSETRRRRAGDKTQTTRQALGEGLKREWRVNPNRYVTCKMVSDSEAAKGVKGNDFI